MPCSAGQHACACYADQDPRRYYTVKIRCKAVCWSNNKAGQAQQSREEWNGDAGPFIHLPARQARKK